jgi:hypothetical protein
MNVLGIEETGVEAWFVAKEEEAFRIGIKSTKGVNIFWESKLSQGAVGGAIWGKLGNHPIGFMKGEEHAGRFGQSEDYSGTFSTEEVFLWSLDPVQGC